MTLSVEIRHLVVDAPGPVDPRLVRAELEAELVRRFADGGGDVGAGAIDRMTLHLPHATDGGADGWGTRLGHVVHAAIDGSGGKR